MKGDKDVAFGSLLRRHRLALGVTQARLAERAGISERAITDLERDPTRLPRLETASLLADALSLKLAERTTFMKAAQSRPDHSSTPPRLLPSRIMTGGDSPPLQLIGRSVELNILESHLLPDSLPVLMLAGEPGIGKSRLLHEAHQRASALGWQVLAGGCQRRGNQEPYAPLLDALALAIRQIDPVQRPFALHGCAWLARLLPELAEDDELTGIMDVPGIRGLSPAQEQRLIFESVARFLSNNAGAQGTLFVLDDLQWAGADALDLLASLARSTAHGFPADPGQHDPRVRIVGAYRDAEVQSTDPLAIMLGDLAQAGLVTHHTLMPLPPEEADALVRALLPPRRRRDDNRVAGWQDDLRKRLVQRTGGVPFFIVSCAEALAAVAGDDVVSQTPVTMMTIQGATPDVILPWTVTQSVHQRVARLREGQRGLLSAAAVVGRDVPVNVLASVTGRSDEEVLDALDAASKLHLLQDDTRGGFRFSHDIVREVLEADLASARRALLHGRIASALEQETEKALSRPVEALAYHYSRSRMTEKAVYYLEQAGDHALSQRAHATAERYYCNLVHTLEQLDQPGETARAREKWASVLRILTSYPQALEVLEQALALYRSMDDQDSIARTIAGIGLLYQTMGRNETGVELMKRALDSMKDTPPSHGLVALYARLAHAWVGDNCERLDLSQRGEKIARQLGDMHAVTQMITARGYALIQLGRLAEARDALQAALEQADKDTDLEGIDSSLLMLIELECWAGDLEEAQRTGTRMVEVARELGDPARIIYRTWLAHMPTMYLGEWAVARAGFEKALAQYKETGLRWGRPVLRLWLSRLDILQGRWAEARDLLDESNTEIKNDRSLRGSNMLEQLYAHLDILEGHPEQAQQRMRQRIAQPGLSELDITFLLPTLAWAELACDDLVSARSTADEAARKARELGVRLALATVLWVQALIALRDGRIADVELNVEEGLALSQQMNYPYMEGSFLHVAGQLAAQTGQSALARTHWQTSLAIFTRLGATQDAAEVQQGLISQPIDSGG